MDRVVRRAAVVAIAVSAFSAVDGARADVPEAADAINAGDCEAAGAAINRGMERGDAQAFFFAGFLFDATGCVATDSARAVKYYRRAADLGNTDAADALGLAYGLGRGVDRDYAEAYRWFGAAKKSTGSPAAGGADARLVGYAATIAHVALGKVRYPAEMERPGIESNFEVVFVPATGDFSVRNAHTGIEVGSNVPRTRIFSNVVRDAYEQAHAELPRPEGLRPTDAFATPWKFAMRRGKYDERLLSQGAITVGETSRAGAQ